MYTKKEILMLYHTSIRNVALFTSVSLALLGAARYYSNKKERKLEKLVYIMFSLLFLFCAVVIDLSLIKTINNFKKEKENHKFIEPIELVAKLIVAVDVTMGIFIIVMLMRQITRILS